MKLDLRSLAEGVQGTADLSFIIFLDDSCEGNAAAGFLRFALALCMVSASVILLLSVFIWSFPLPCPPRTSGLALLAAPVSSPGTSSLGRF